MDIHSFLLLSLILLLFSGAIQMAVHCITLEKQSLLEFKESLYDPSARLSSWRADTDCCQWRGVSCHSKTGHVLKLQLQNPIQHFYVFSGYMRDSSGWDTSGYMSFASGWELYVLGGWINPSITNLKYLNHLDLSMNNFTGIPIPEFFGSFSKLTYLNLSHSSFSGKIPPNIGTLTELRQLDLNIALYSTGQELIAGDIYWLSRLLSLRYLNLGGLDLNKPDSHWLEAINTLPSLLELHLPDCQLSYLPLFLTYVNLTSLRVLDLSSNYFNSTMPRWLFNLSTLTHLDLGSNNLNGSLQDVLAKLTSLKTLDLSFNGYIKGELSRRLGNNLCKLEILSLSDNSITGGITEFIEGISGCGNNSLQVLDLSINNLIGYLPDSLGSLKNLRQLSLSSNSLTGSIPETIGNLSFLEELDLLGNQMSGTIPETLGKLSSLDFLSLDNKWEGGVITERHLENLSSLEGMSIFGSSSRNNNVPLVFNISPDWIPPFKLKSMLIHSCRIGPEFPAWLRNQNELIALRMDSVGISSSIPDWFLNLGLRLDRFMIPHNNLSGKVPNSFQFTFGSFVDVSFNHFEGPLPLWSSNVSYLSLKGNLFSGSIPTNLGLAMPNLRQLDISKNYLNGSIPLSIGNLTSLNFLVISDNQLSGNIPNFWSWLPLLSVLDISNNSLLSGKIPSSIGSLHQLEYLILSGNNLSGELPFELKNLSILVILSLGDNKLAGRVPAWIGESMISLRVLGLQNNFLTQHIPSQISNLSNLILLDLSNTRLSGIIPPCLGDLSALKSDDPSSAFLYGINYISYEGHFKVVTKGTILQYDSTLYLVKGIDLSNNNLSGNIPIEMMNLSHLGILNLSMNHLTGGIPERIGMLKWLETLDLSRNKLSGPIPETLAEMTFLSHLNLSYNNLSGKVPTGKQLEVLNDPSIYLGNKALCGQPLPECVNHKNTSSSGDIEENGESNKIENLWFFIVIGSGYFLGFWGFWCCLIFKKQWRIAYFRFVERLICRLFGRFKMCN